MPTMDELWHCEDEAVWRFALKTYWLFVKPENRKLEEELDSLGLEYIQKLDPQGWYEFLLENYFRWKFTAANIYAANSNHLRKYHPDGLDELFAIKERLLAFDRKDEEQGLKIAGQIRGLRTAGASGLLALMYPQVFGTVDQFVLNALLQVEGLQETSELKKMRRENLSPDDGIRLISIMRRKASENNLKLGCSFWTPRKMDMVLWAYGHGSQ